MLTIGEKPFIVSMSDVAASGGYHIACPADVIVADGNTITGSIGVISGKPTLRRLYNKLGISKDTVHRGRHALAASDYYRLTEEEMALLDEATRQEYWKFVTLVAEGRDMTPAAVDSIGEGRVFTGRQALANGLVDELGGLNRALTIAMEQAGLPPDAEIEIIAYPQCCRGLFTGMIQSVLSRAANSLPIAALRDSRAAEGAQLLELLEDEHYVYMMPYVIDPE
jgi:protease-4